MSEFFMTYGRSRPSSLIPWIEHKNVPILTNAINRWSENTERLLPMWEYDTKHTLDAGGYNVQSSFVTESGNIRSTVSKGEVSDELSSEAPFYPWSVKEYHEWLSNHSEEFEWATVMDYACEERFDQLWSLEERMEKTIENTVSHYNHNPDYKVLPVLQGKTVDDYVKSYEMLRERGIPTDHVGIGTVCRISSQKEILNVEKSIRERTKIDKIHGFGVKVSAYGLGAEFETADSAAWVSEAKNGRVYNIERKDNGDLRLYGEDMRNEDTISQSSRRRTIHSFQTYYAYVTWLMEGEPAVDVDTLIERQEMDMDEYISHIDHLLVDDNI